MGGLEEEERRATWPRIVLRVAIAATAAAAAAAAAWVTDPWRVLQTRFPWLVERNSIHEPYPYPVQVAWVTFVLVLEIPWLARFRDVRLELVELAELDDALERAETEATVNGLLASINFEGRGSLKRPTSHGDPAVSNSLARTPRKRVRRILRRLDAIVEAALNDPPDLDPAEQIEALRNELHEVRAEIVVMRTEAQEEGVRSKRRYRIGLAVGIVGLALTAFGVWLTL